MAPNILLYERPFSSRLFRDVINGVHGDSDVTGISSYRGSSDIWSGEYLYDGSLDYAPSISEEEIEDIIVRDRSLVVMSRERARRIVSRFWNGVERLFQEERFRYLYTISIDCHEIDIMLRLADRYGVTPVSFVGCFIPGYALISLRGERGRLGRDVPMDEAESVASALLDKYYLPPSELQSVKRSVIDARKYYYRRYLIERIYNPIQRMIKRDPDNLMYNVPLIGNRKLADLMDDAYDQYFTPLEGVSIEKNTVYHPLHVVPEASTSYFCKDIAKQGYENYICSIVENAEADIDFLIKEHPSMYGKRNLSFYDRLRGYSNVKLIAPYVSSNELLEMVDTVLVDNGTVGFEALLRGKRVLALEASYYSDLHPNLFRVDSVKIDDLNRPLQMYDSIAIVGSLLEDLFPSDYSNNKQQAACSVDQIVNGVSMYLGRLEAR